MPGKLSGRSESDALNFPPRRTRTKNPENDLPESFRGDEVNDVAIPLRKVIPTSTSATMAMPLWSGRWAGELQFSIQPRGMKGALPLLNQGFGDNYSWGWFLVWMWRSETYLEQELSPFVEPMIKLGIKLGLWLLSEGGLNVSHGTGDRIAATSHPYSKTSFSLWRKHVS